MAPIYPIVIVQYAHLVNLGQKMDLNKHAQIGKSAHLGNAFSTRDQIRQIVHVRRANMVNLPIAKIKYRVQIGKHVCQVQK